MYRLHTPPQEVGRALLIVMRRGSLRAAEEITSHKYETIGRWLRLAAEHADALTEVLVHDLQLSALEVDEFWSFVRRRSATSRRWTRRDGASAGAWWFRIARVASSLLMPAADDVRRLWQLRRSEKPMLVREGSRWAGVVTVGELILRQSRKPIVNRWERVGAGDHPWSYQKGFL
jgi:hypothetical protein